MSKKSKLPKAVREDRRRAASELDEIQNSLFVAYALFNSTLDPELLDACIYEINALRARYDHALRRARLRFADSG